MLKNNDIVAKAGPKDNISKTFCMLKNQKHQNISKNHSSDKDSEDFLYAKITKPSIYLQKPFQRH